MDLGLSLSAIQPNNTIELHFKLNYPSEPIRDRSIDGTQQLLLMKESPRQEKDEEEKEEDEN